MDTSKENNLDLLKYKDFDSIYEQTNYIGWQLENKGHDYSKDLIQRNTSRYMLNNRNVSDMFPYLNRILSYLIDRVKYVRNFYNYGVDRDYKHIN